jgi:hypothetical protein
MRDSLMKRRQLELSGDFAEANTDASTIRTNPAVAARVSGLPSRPDSVTWYGSNPFGRLPEGAAVGDARPRRTCVSWFFVRHQFVELGLPFSREPPELRRELPEICCVRGGSALHTGPERAKHRP